MFRAIIGARSGISTGCRFLSAAAVRAAKTPIEIDFESRAAQRGWPKESFKKQCERKGYSAADYEKAIKYAKDFCARTDISGPDGDKKESYQDFLVVEEYLNPKYSLAGIKIDGGFGAVVELACESYSPIREEPFQQLLVSLTSEVLEHAKKLQWDEGNTMQMKKLDFENLNDSNGKSLRQAMIDCAFRIEEFLAVKSVNVYKVPEGMEFFTHAHPANMMSGVAMGADVSVQVKRNPAYVGWLGRDNSDVMEDCPHEELIASLNNEKVIGVAFFINDIPGFPSAMIDQ